MICEMYQKFYDASFSTEVWDKERFVSLEQIEVNHGRIKISGEHIMTHSGVVSLKENFCGADEAITDYKPGAPSWNATLINIADTAEALDTKRAKVFDAIGVLQGEAMEVMDPEPIL